MSKEVQNIILSDIPNNMSEITDQIFYVVHLVHLGVANKIILYKIILFLR